MNIIHDQWGGVEGVNTSAIVIKGNEVIQWTKRERGAEINYHESDGWRQVPEVVEEDVTAHIKLDSVAGIEGRSIMVPRCRPGWFSNFLYEPSYFLRKTEMYDLPEDWWSQFLSDDNTVLLPEFLKQFRKPAITVWRRGEK